MDIDLAARRVAVTGGGGFVGSHVVEALRRRGCDPFAPRRSAYDLRSEGGIRAFLEDARPEIVFHLAGSTGGIGANRARPAEFIFDNLVMGTRLIDAAYRSGVGKFVCIGTICSYPKHTPVPFKEDDLWNGYPDEVSAPYGVSKKALAVQLDAYQRQYGFNGIFLMPVNVYGPRDNFDPQSSNVVAAFVRRFVEGRRTGAEEVTCWGTGAATREFIYADDCAEGILLAAERHHDPQPVNLGSGQEIAIRDLAATVAERAGYRGRIQWDHSHPDGQPRRSVDVSRARERFGFTAQTPLAEGLARTIEWYERHGGAEAQHPSR